MYCYKTQNITVKNVKLIHCVHLNCTYSSYLVGQIIELCCLIEVIATKCVHISEHGEGTQSHSHSHGEVHIQCDLKLANVDLGC